MHRDIKPGNVLLQKGTRSLRTSASQKAIAAPTHDAGTFTQMRITLGTPAYMSPEQAAGDELDGRSDLLSRVASPWAREVLPICYSRPLTPFFRSSAWTPPPYVLTTQEK